MESVLRNSDKYPIVCLHILGYMQENWPAHLTYHSLSHTLDVANVCDNYIDFYGIGVEDANLVRIAAISHDIGYLIAPVDHEELGIELVRPFLENLLDKPQLENVNNMIRATKVPQRPTNIFEEILADADLDYLGREDYDLQSEKLYLEFLRDDILNHEKEWLEAQIRFLENHTYHTSFAKENRAGQKHKKLVELKQKLAES